MDNYKEQKMNLTKIYLIWILLVSMSPIAILIGILTVLFSFLRFLFKASLLFIIVAINTPFIVLYNVSVVVYGYNLAHFGFLSNSKSWIRSDPRTNVSVDVQVIVSNFFRVIAGELLVALSTGIITFYTAPLLVFYISTSVGLVAIFHKWLNTNSLSKTALSCLCGGYGLNPMMFLLSFIGLFDIGCHPIAKCSFVSPKAFLFVKDGVNRFETHMIVSDNTSINFFNWNAFEGSLFQLSPRIDIIVEDDKYILKSFMVLKLLHHFICEYRVERLELPDDYSKLNELFSFLVTL